MKYLLDTNVLSERQKPNPDARVLHFLNSGNWGVPAPVLAEIQDGIEDDPNAARKIQLNHEMDEFLKGYRDLVVNWDAETARTWGRLKHSAEVKRQPQALWDSLIDAMAVRYSLIVATRNTADFRHAETFNPWTA